MRLENAPARPRAQRRLQSFGQGANPLMAVVRAGSPATTLARSSTTTSSPPLAWACCRFRPRRPPPRWLGLYVSATGTSSVIFEDGRPNPLLWTSKSGVRDAPAGSGESVAAWEREFHAGRDHRGPAGVDRLDDLLRIDALQIDRGHAEVAVPELALDDVQRHALAQQLKRVRVPQLVRSEAATHAGPGRAPMQRGARRGCMPGASAAGAVDHAEQRTDRHRLTRAQPWLELLKAPVVHADLAAPAAFAAAHEHRAAARVEIELTEIECFLDAQPGPPKQHDQPPGRVAVVPVAAAAHDRAD